MNTRRAGLIALVLALAVVIVGMQYHLDPLRQRYQPGKITNVEIGAEFIAATLIGLKEVVAGLLWVRTDEFFHTGNYDAIIPMVRIITWLDPHMIDVYDTGAWHLAYNFTDSQERSDRRYIPAARALLREGIRNNPNTFDLYFSLGWMNFNKAQDYPLAITWFGEANKKKAVDSATGKTKNRPQFVGHSLAHAYEKAGDPDKAIRQWQRNIVSNQGDLKADPKDPGNMVMVIVAKNNLKQVMQQKAVRDKLMPVLNPGFEANWQLISARKFRVWGTLNLPVGCRIRLRLVDKGFKEHVFDRFSWDIDQDQTILQDDLYVRDGKFNRVIDIERDAAIYPLKSDNYVLTMTFNPLNAPDEARDLVGWKGEGLAPQKYLVVESGVRMLEKRFEIKRSQLL